MPYSTLVHHFPSPTPHSCAYELGSPAAHNAIIFVGGLGDGPHTIPYVRTIADHIEGKPDLSYSVFEIRMTSSFSGFGFSSLEDDVSDISALVKYLRSIDRQKIVILGHSTGCQDCVQYARTSRVEPLPLVDGFILQGPVSDREAMTLLMSQEDISAALALAASMMESGKKDDVMPRSAVPAIDTPVTAYRWHALIARDGDDDFFSSDIPAAKVGDIWSSFARPVLILHSADDQHVPASVNIEALTKQWVSCCAPDIASPLSGSIPGANHRVEQDESQLWMAKTVASFLESLAPRYESEGQQS